MNYSSEAEGKDLVVTVSDPLDDAPTFGSGGENQTYMPPRATTPMSPSRTTRKQGQSAIGGQGQRLAKKQTIVSAHDSVRMDDSSHMSMLTDN